MSKKILKRSITRKGILERESAKQPIVPKHKTRIVVDKELAQAHIKLEEQDKEIIALKETVSISNGYLKKEKTDHVTTRGALESHHKKGEILADQVRDLKEESADQLHALKGRSDEIKKLRQKLTKKGFEIEEKTKKISYLKTAHIEALQSKDKAINISTVSLINREKSIRTFIKLNWWIRLSKTRDDLRTHFSLI